MKQNGQPEPLPSLLKNIYVILCHTSHPGNIGAAARAMKTMGLTNLILVSPNIMSTPITLKPPVFDPKNPQAFTIPEESFILASNAKDILEQAQVFSSLQSAIESMHLTCALTSRRREITVSLQTPKEVMPKLIQAAKAHKKVALIFGSETFGLSIDEVSLCNRLITINGNPEYLSLNLAQAVQVITYELFSQLNQSTNFLEQEYNFATRKEILGLMQHLEDTMNSFGFFQNKNRARLMRRLYKIANKSNLESEEIDILRGFLSFLNKKIDL